MEVHRFQVLAKDTLIFHGFSNGTLLPVPDPESELKVTKQIINVKIADENPTSTCLKKRKLDDQHDFNDNILTTTSSPDPKRPKNAQVENIALLKSNAVDQSFLPSAGCSWTAENWSCAYDSVFMSLYCLYIQSSLQLRYDLRSISGLANSLAQSYDILSRPLHHTMSAFNQERDKLRDELSSINPTLFRRFGEVGTSVSSIIDVIFPSSTRKLIILPSCPSGCSFLQSFSYSISDDTFPTVIVPPEIKITGDTHNIIFLNKYISNFLSNTSQTIQSSHYHKKKFCQKCDSALSVISVALLRSPPLLFFEIPAEAGSSVFSVLPSPHINLPSLNCQISYRLAAVIYLGDYHFTCRLVIGDHGIWQYDGQIDDGIPYRDIHIHNLSSAQSHFLSNMSFLGTRKAHMFIYVRVD